MKTILVDAVEAFVIEGKGVYKPMHNLLEQYPNKKIILTGANDEQFKKFGLDKMPYEVFTLKHNPEKTDPKYFEILLDRYGLKAGEVVYFEHNPEAVKSAQSVGISSYHYDPDKKDLEALKRFLDENGTEAMLTCPKCGTPQKVDMPADACQHFYKCTSCGEILKPKEGDCCVFCSYADTKCPPKQAEAT